MSDVERLLAYEEIRQLAARYAVAMDSRDLDALVSLFAEDYRHWDGQIGRHALREFIERVFREGMAGEVSFALTGGHLINLVDANHANGTVYCLAEFGDEGRWIRQIIAYEDTYERQDGLWYFTFRNHQLFYGAALDRRPLDQEPANWPKGIVGRGSLPYRWQTWKSFMDGS